MLRSQMRVLASARMHLSESSVAHSSQAIGTSMTRAHPHPHSDGHAHDLSHAHAHDHNGGPHYHSHGWGMVHTHDLEALTAVRPKLPMLLALGIAGGLLPDPGALAILLAAIAKGQFLLGILTVVVFSLGFASVLVVVGLVAARLGQLILDMAEQPMDLLGSDRSGAADHRGRPCPHGQRLAPHVLTRLIRMAAPIIGKR